MSALDIICPKRRARRMCADAFGVEERRLVAAGRRREIVIPRHATYFVLRQRFPEMSLPQLGRFMGGRDHSTILHGVRAIEERMARDPELRLKVWALVRGRIPEPFDLHVRAWEAERALMALAAARPVNPAVKVLPPKPVNARVDDDIDAVRRKAGADALGAAIRAAGGWRPAAGNAAA